MDNALRYALAKVEVAVTDINDNVPVFDYDMYNITVMENLPPGFTVVQVHAVDRDSVSDPVVAVRRHCNGLNACDRIATTAVRSGDKTILQENNRIRSIHSKQSPSGVFATMLQNGESRWPRVQNRWMTWPGMPFE